MAYVKQNFVDGNVLHASELNHMEEGIGNAYIKPSGGIPSADIASSAITSAKIASSAIATAKIANEAVTRVKLAEDALYSPINSVSTATYSVVADDIGKTILLTYSGAVTVSISNAVASSLPQGAEIAFIKSTNHSISIAVGSDWFLAKPGELGSKGRTLTCSEGYQLVAVKKIGTNWFCATGAFD